MKEEIMQKIILEMKINDLLNELKRITEDAYDYMTGYKDIEESDMIVKLENAEYIIENIEDSITTLEEEFEIEILKHSTKNEK